MNDLHQTNELDLWTSRQADQNREIQRHRTLWTIKQWELLAHHMLHVRCAATGSGISDVDPHGATRGHPACIAATGATRDDEQQEQCRESPGGCVGAWQSLTERQLENSIGEGAERLRSSSEADPEGRQRGDVLRAMRALREQVATHSFDHFDAGFGDGDPHGQEQNGETASRDRTPFLPSRAREHDNAGFATAESPLGMLDVQYKSRAQP